jgi:hypothetical protein
VLRLFMYVKGLSITPTTLPCLAVGDLVSDQPLRGMGNTNVEDILMSQATIWPSVPQTVYTRLGTSAIAWECRAACSATTERVRCKWPQLKGCLDGRAWPFGGGIYEAHLTYPEEQLAAMSALAESITSQNGVYIARLWKSYFSSDLPWRRAKSGTLEGFGTYDAPTLFVALLTSVLPSRVRCLFSFERQRAAFLPLPAHDLSALTQRRTRNDPNRFVWLGSLSESHTPLELDLSADFRRPDTDLWRQGNPDIRHLDQQMASRSWFYLF